MCVSAAWENHKVLQGNNLMEPCYIFFNRRYKYVNKNRGNAGLDFMRNFISVEPGLHLSCQHIDFKYFLGNMNTDHYNYVKTKSYAESLKTC